MLLCDRKIVMNRDYNAPLFTFQTFLSQYSSVAKYRKNERKIYMNFISFEELIVLLRTIAVYYPKFEFFCFCFFLFFFFFLFFLFFSSFLLYNKYNRSFMKRKNIHCVIEFRALNVVALESMLGSLRFDNGHT